MTAFAAIVVLILSGSAWANHGPEETPFDDEQAEACDPAYGGHPDNLECIAWEGVVFWYHCGLWAPDGVPRIVLDTVDVLADEAYPMIQQTKCNLHDGVEDDRQWWNNDVFAWERAVWCWAWGGPNNCPDDPDTPQNEERQSMYWYIMNVLVDCQEEGCPNSPPSAPALLPPPPPYP